MKKILILANSSKGLYGFRNELVKRILEEYELVVSIPDDICKEELEKEGCKVIHTDINRRGVNPIEDFKLIKSYKKLLKEEKPDLVLTYTIKPNIYGGWACKKLNIPYLVTITGLGTAFQNDGIMRKLIVSMYKAGINKAECVFFQNGDNKKIFEKYGIQGKSSKLVMGSGVNLNINKFEDYSKSDKTVFLFVGRIMRDKGFLEFLEAAKILKSENVSFEIVGGCEDDLQKITDEAVARGEIVWHGFQKDVHDYFKKCSALVQPSYHEGMSNVILEASATGRPIIASDIPGCREGFENGKTGIAFEPRSTQSLVSALKSFLSMNTDERKQMGENARAKMEKEFDRTMVVNDYLKEIHKVII